MKAIFTGLKNFSDKRKFCDNELSEMIDKYLAITILQLFFLLFEKQTSGNHYLFKRNLSTYMKNTTHTHPHTHLAQTFQDRKVGGQYSADKTRYFAFTI